MSEVKDRPTICKKSQEIVANGPSIQTFAVGIEEQIRRHKDCYFKPSNIDDDHSHTHSHRERSED